MKYLLIFVLAAVFFSFGCSFRIGTDNPSTSPKVYHCPNHDKNFAQYGSVILGARSLPFPDRAELLTSIAKKNDLTPADRNLIVEESQSLPFPNRAEVLKALVDAKANLGSNYPCDPPNVHHYPNHDKNFARYGSVILGTRSLPFTDRAVILTSIAQKQDLTPADRNLIVEESQSLPFPNRADILKILAETKTNP